MLLEREREREMFSNIEELQHRERTYMFDVVVGVDVVEVVVGNGMVQGSCAKNEDVCCCCCCCGGNDDEEEVENPAPENNDVDCCCCSCGGNLAGCENCCDEDLTS